MLKKGFGIIIIVMLQLILLGGIANAAEIPLRPENFAAEYPVYNQTTQENKMELNWSASNGADFYIIDVTSETNWANQTITEELSTTNTTYTDIRLNSASNPTSGTVFTYHLYAATYERDGEGNPTSEYVKSTNYATVTVLTNLSASAVALSTSEVKLIWDDIKYDGSSIDYEIVKQKRGVNVGMEQIKASEIGQSAIRVNGKLQYTIRNLDKSTEYSFLIYPMLSSGVIKFNPYVSVSGATNLSALVQRYNESIVKLLWDEYQGSIPSTDLYYRVIEITEIDGQKTYNTIATPEVPYYFIQIDDEEEHSYAIEVRQKEDDVKVAESGEVSLEDMIVPTTPAVSDLEYTVDNDSITLFWDTHKNIDGSRDTDVLYDVWLVTEPENVDDIRAYYSDNNAGITDRRTASNLEITDGISSNINFNLVQINGEYKYSFNINNLIQNNIYYIGVIAKKTYIMQDLEDPNSIITSVYTSEPTIETIRTTSGNLEQPVSLVAPLGVSLKYDDSGQLMVTQDTITIKWPLGVTENGEFTAFYQDDIYFKVGYEEYTDTFDKNDTNNPDEPDYNVHTTNVAIVKEDEEAYATITDLESNTKYVFWVKAYRDVTVPTSLTKVSEASDPIIIVTLPEYVTPDAKPPVPLLTTIDNLYEDRITVRFNSTAGMEYTIVWATEDSVTKKVGQLTYTPTSSVDPDSVVIEDLEPETTYYFWVKATNGTMSSEWSDSAIGTTIPIPPPNTPQGFGLKKVVEDGELVPDIGEHHVSVQWDAVEGITYIIEISKSEDFGSSEQITAGEVSEYTITEFGEEELQSNTRYWIRIFAKNIQTNKTSGYSPYLTVKTEYNYDEYNSSQETETPLEGDLTSEIINGNTGTWTVNITEGNAQRLIETVRYQHNMDYEIDLSETSVSGINKWEITIPYTAVDGLSDINQNLIIKTNCAQYTLLPGWLDLSSKNIVGQGINIKINLQTITSPTTKENGLYYYLSDTSLLEAYAIGNQETQITQFNKPIKIKLNYTDNSVNGIIDLYYLEPGETSWTKLSETHDIVSGVAYVTAYNDKCGKYAVKKQGISSEILTYKYNDEINELLATGLMKSVDSKDINPLLSVTLEAAVKMLLDSAEVNYTDDYMIIASKAGILNTITNTTPSRYITRQEAITMVMRLYEIKTGQILPSTSIPSMYIDAGSVDSIFRGYVANALKMNIYNPEGSYLRPKNYATRGEMLVLIRNFLGILGKI